MVLCLRHPPFSQVDLTAIDKLYEYGRLQFGFGAYEFAALYLANYRVLVGDIFSVLRVCLTVILAGGCASLA